MPQDHDDYLYERDRDAQWEAEQEEKEAALERQADRDGCDAAFEREEEKS